MTQLKFIWTNFAIFKHFSKFFNIVSFFFLCSFFKLWAGEVTGQPLPATGKGQRPSPVASKGIVALGRTKGGHATLPPTVGKKDRKEKKKNDKWKNIQKNRKKMSMSTPPHRMAGWTTLANRQTVYDSICTIEIIRLNWQQYNEFVNFFYFFLWKWVDSFIILL